jgi:phosphoribosylanthranilate isomerase
MTTLIKICGMTDIAAVEAAVEGGADAVGFVFAESVRRVSMRHALEMSEYVPLQTKRVAVMMHPSTDEWREVKDIFQPDVLQTDLADFEYLDVPDRIEKWPVLREGAMLDGDVLPDLFVYEGKASGSGTAVDWQLAAELATRGKLILAGGLSAENVQEAVRQVAPFGVDVSSGVESSPGKKDASKIQTFIDSVKASGSPEEEPKV